METSNGPHNQNSSLCGYEPYERFVEVDALRGLAIIMMVTYHTLFDLNFFSVLDMNMSSPFIWMFGRITATIFIFLVGVSLSLSHSRRNLTGTVSFSYYLLRGLKIFIYGMIITVITWVYPGEGFIVFGVLHFIGVAVILAYPFIGRRLPSAIMAITAILLGFWFSNISLDTPLLIWLGLKPHNFYTLDYLPLFPWIGAVMIGIIAGDILYPGYRRRFNLRVSTMILDRLAVPGRNSLKIYFIHQPIIVASILMLQQLT